MRSPGGYFINRAKAYLSQQRIAEGTDKGESHCTDKLRQYQQKILERAKSGDNLIIVAPTGSGKTAIAVHRSAEVLRGDDERRIVFLAPTVALAEQQACAYQSTAPFRHGAFKVECRCGENPVAPKQWSTVLRSCHVLVMTPQTLLNMLDSGNAHIDQISLLILDECHHARDNHSFAKVLVHYRKSSQQTQLLGFTASPVSKRSMVSTYNGLQVLMDNMRADFVILDANNLELKEVVNKANERAPILIQPRQEDIHFGKKLGAFIIWAISITGPLIPVPEPTCSTTTSFQKESSAVLPHEVAKMLQEGRWCSTAAIWCKKAAEKLLQSSMSSHINDLICCLRLVRVAVTTLALVGDIGYEVAVRHLSREYAGIAVEVVGSVEKLNDVLYCRNNEEFAFNNSYQRTLQLIQHLVEETIDVHTLKEAYKCAFQCSTEHPKFKALCNVLKDKVQMKDFHGIVFARTREAVRSLVQLMKALPDFQEVEVFAFMGHGGQKRDTSIKGMRVKEQQQVMSQYKTPGRKLLISTAAGEEGIDVPSCEFVVRYTATQTGRELIQSRGRTRKPGSEYIQILEHTGKELALTAKSKQEEANLNFAMANLKAFRIC